jgi:hypothetical protein
MSVLNDITQFTSQYRDHLIRSRLETVYCDNTSFDIQLLELKGKSRPARERFTLLLVAGVHGLESIGVTVLLHFLTHLIETSRSQLLAVWLSQHSTLLEFIRDAERRHRA